MNQMLIILPIISILTIGSVLYLQDTQHNNLKQAEDNFNIERCQKLHSPNFIQWNQCKLSIIDNPCQSTEEYKLALKQFNDLTQFRSDKLANECKDYYDYFFKSSIDDPVNKNGYYQRCFYISSRVLQITNSNSCFKQYYHQPKFVECAGL